MTPSQLEAEVELTNQKKRNLKAIKTQLSKSEAAFKPLTEFILKVHRLLSIYGI